jgi:NTE family protein
MMIRARAGFAYAALTASLWTGCASYRATPRLARYDLAKGYRFDSLALDTLRQARNSDDIFVALAFSGGGTRAAALSYGVLDQLRRVKFHWDPTARAPVRCRETDSVPCRGVARTLLDEVDVISSVSGGSFTSAYYALRGREIFDTASRFHRGFLYHPVQRDLLLSGFKPSNWKRLRSRVEIASEYYASNVFGTATFKELERRPRPYLILNATDASTGARFEFTQEQFDLLCADLSAFPIARGVAASSAFPGLLNSMTVDSHNATGCGFNGPGTRKDDWVDQAFEAGFASLERLTAAQELVAYRDPTRKHLHLLDGGLADNIGLRSILQSLHSADRPTVILPDSSALFGGWSLLTKIRLDQVKTIIVITVDSRTHRQGDWDTKKTGPNSFAVLTASAGIPMGNYSTESLAKLREYGNEAELNQPGEPRFYGVEVTLTSLPDSAEQEYLRQVGTNFELTRHQVDCLIDRGAALLRKSTSVTDPGTTTGFEKFVEQHLGGVTEAPTEPSPTCTLEESKKLRPRPRHTLDVGLQYTITNPSNDDELRRSHRLGLMLRIAKHDGLGASVSYAQPVFKVRSALGSPGAVLGKLTLHSVLAGGYLARRIGPVEAHASVAAGYAFSRFTLSAAARERFGSEGAFGVDADVGSTWIVKPSVGVWWDFSDKVAATVGAAWLAARPRLEFDAGAPEPTRHVGVRAYQFTTGLAYRLY